MDPTHWMREEMNVSDNETPGATVLKKAAGAEEAVRPPLAPSEKNNAVPVPVSRKPRTKEVASRYKMGINPITIPPRSTLAATRRCPSPGAERVSISPPSASRKRSQSAEKRRPTTPTFRSSAPSSPVSSRSPGSSSPSSRPSTPVHEAGPADILLLSSRRFSGGRAPDGLWPSMRNLSSSLLPESASAPLAMRGKPTERRSTFISDHSSRPATAVLEEKTAPSRRKNASDRLEILKNVANQHRWPAASHDKFSSMATPRCMESIARAVGVYASPASRGVSPTRRVYISDGSRKGLQRNVNGLTRRASLDGSGRLDPELSSTAGAFANVLERTPSWSHPSRMPSVHHARLSRPSSPIKASLPSISTSRSVASPSRARPSTPTSPSTPVARVGMPSSILSYYVNLKKGKKGSSQTEDAHHLRLLHNRYLQWRFVNARADSATSVQRIKAELILHRTWVATSMMCDSVVSKRCSMQKLKLVMKLLFLLGDQMTSLEEWALMERELSSSLSGAIEALKARTLKLPVTRGAKVESYSLKDAMSTAVDIMQAMSSFISQLLTRVEAMNSLACELAEVTACESAMLGECRELLTLTAAMQVEESSFRTNLIQLRRDYMTRTVDSPVSHAGMAS